jgi:TadE-like protein
MMRRRLSTLRSSSGQSLLEFALLSPLMIALSLGVVEVSYALLDQNVVTRLTREGSNLISRDTSMTAAGITLSSMSSRPVNFNNGNSKVIFSVILRVPTTGAANFGKDILFQRYELGTLPQTSTLTMQGSGSFPAPDYQAVNSDTNTGLQITNLAPNLLTNGGLLYVTEIYTKHPLITPLDKFGISLPTTLYSIAYF